MEQTVEKQFTSDLFNQILTTYQLDLDYKKLGDFENYAFEVYEKGEPKILRITHSSHRSQQELEAELDWIQYLHHHGVSIPAVFLSPQGNTVEVFKAEESFFFASLFEKAPGNGIKLDDEMFNARLFYQWGKVIGKMHRLTKNYVPSNGIQPRYHWDQNDLLIMDQYFPAQSVLLERAHSVVAEIKNLPMNRDNYGLIHTDAHHGNFFYDGHRIHVFDFDDAAYHYFASDIAIPLYYAVNSKQLHGTKDERNEFAREFLTAFLKGYQEENDLAQEWIETIPLFLKLRDVELYAVFNKKVPVEERNEFVKKWMSEIHDRIENNQAIIDFELL